MGSRAAGCIPGQTHTQCSAASHYCSVMCPLPAAGERPCRQGLQAAWQHPACRAGSSAGHCFSGAFSSPTMIILIQMIITQPSDQPAASCGPIELVYELRERIPLSSVLRTGGRFIHSLHQSFLPLEELGGLCSIAFPCPMGEHGQRAPSSAHRAGAQHRSDKMMLEWADGGHSWVGTLLLPYRAFLPLWQRVLLAASCSLFCLR